jgi:predicted amidohydrolase YtcJ
MKLKQPAIAAAFACASAHATDLIITNGKVATMTKEGAFAQALAIKDGKIEAVGSNAQILKLKSAKRKSSTPPAGP